MPRCASTQQREPIISQGTPSAAIYEIPGEIATITPTDVAQFIRREQCERFLRLRLYARATSERFMPDYGVQPESIPPLLRLSGSAFERDVEQRIAAHYRLHNLANAASAPNRRPADNGRVLDHVKSLAPGATLILSQVRLEAMLGGWLLRGDADLIRLDRHEDGSLSALVADIKRSSAGRLEHRLQVAFYIAMLKRVLQDTGIELQSVQLGVLYRGPAHDGDAISDDERDQLEHQRAAVREWFGPDLGFLELTDDVENYREAVADLVTGPASTASRIASAPFDEVPYHLGPHCDSCIYQQFCMKWSAEHDDLSLLPHLTAIDKSVLRRSGIRTVRQLSDLKSFATNGDGEQTTELVPTQGHQEQSRRLSATWPVGPRLDELVHRARRYRNWKGDDVDYLPFIPHKGYPSLPHTGPDHNPNLVSIYIDTQHDYLNDRVYLLGARVVAHGNGEPASQRSIVHMTDSPPETADRERDMLTAWVNETVESIIQLARPDGDGQSRAPVHLIFFDRREQKLLLEALARHFDSIMGATPLYDFVTQIAAFDSPLATFLDEEIRDFKNYPMVCQSLHAVAAYLKFNWNTPELYREIFRTGVFDFWGRLGESDDRTDWYFRRSRFSSQLPLEYAYAAWGTLGWEDAAVRSRSVSYREATAGLLRGFQVRRLEALEHIAGAFRGNEQTLKSTFDLPDLDGFSDRPGTLAQALDEFVTIERHVELADWKAARYAQPERRALSGDTLLVRYRDTLQDQETRDLVQKSRPRQEQREQYEREFWDANPDADKLKLSKEQRDATNWSYNDHVIRFEVVMEGIDCDLDDLLGRLTLREGEPVIIFRRWDVDSRLPEVEQVPYTPTAKQLLYGARGRLHRIAIERDNDGNARSASVEIAYRSNHFTDRSRGFAFASFLGDRDPLRDDEVYTIDSDPNSYYGYWTSKVTQGLVEDGRNALYDRLTDPASLAQKWPEAARAAQARFQHGLAALCDAGALHPFEVSKQEYVGRHGEAPTLLVQGPPGTGKSYASAYALFARVQGAFAADLDYRTLLSCKTHAATDELLRNVAAVQHRLATFREQHPQIFEQYFDERLLLVPVYRINPRSSVSEGVIPVGRNGRPEETRKVADILGDGRRFIAAATPGGTYGMIKDRWGSKKLFGREIVDCLVLDEASQLTLPEALMAALPLKRDGWLIVVGDHRQMPPIVKHAWDIEPRRSVQEFRGYESLFTTLLLLDSPIIQFEESFRLHADMAEFLRREIYHQDGISYFSRQQETLPERQLDDPFIASVLDPRYPIVVIVHDEDDSQHRNPFEQHLVSPILKTLADPRHYGLEPREGLGVVVPHRAQRAALQESNPALVIVDPVDGSVQFSAVDTVERFQGGERNVILISATESDREYLLNAADFLLDPRRLTVALSRARHKLILIASRSIFNLFSIDEETFENSLLWKHLLRRTCTRELWTGERHGYRVEVWGNDQTDVESV